MAGHYEDVIRRTVNRSQNTLEYAGRSSETEIIGHENQNPLTDNRTKYFEYHTFAFRSIIPLVMRFKCDCEGENTKTRCPNDTTKVKIVGIR